jgi:exonuclease SbcC
MRLHRLDLSAFGPFAAAVSVDFDALADHGVFLLTGPTGAGKTSVLDAVCYALFGAVPGARQGAKRLRSDHAACEVRTRVQLEVTLRGRRLRVTREPDQERPKQRGTGTTTDKARGTLEERVGGEWQAVSIRLDEIGHELELLMGMSREQFCQVVLLPQGDFAAFLRTDADGRRALLQRLFGTERFENVEDRLREWRIEAARVRDTARIDVDKTLAQLAEVGGDVERAEDADPMAWADDVLDTAHKRLVTAKAQAAVARTAAQRARDRHKTAEELVTRQQQHADAVRRKEQLEGRRVDWVLAEAELAAAHRAARVVPLLSSAVVSGSAAVAARATLTAARSDLAAQPDPGHALAQETTIELTTRVRDVRAEAGTLQALLKLEQDAAARAAEAVQHRAAAVAASEGAREHEQWLGAYDTRRARRGEQLVAAQQLAALIEPRRDGVLIATQRLAAAVERDRLFTERTALHDTVSLLVDRAQDARERLIDLREKRISGMAGELAVDLMPGQPCPVCGSAEHPAPAAVGAFALTGEDEATAEAEYGVAEQDRRNAENALRDGSTSLATAQAQAGGNDAVDTHEVQLAAARIALTEAQDAAAAIGELTAEINSLDDERTQRELNRAALRESEQVARTHAAEAQRFVDGAATQLMAARGGDRSIAARADRLRTLAQLIDAVVMAERDDHHALTAAAQARGDAETAAVEAGFRDTDDAADAARDDRRLTELDALINGCAAEEAAVREWLSDPALATAAAAPPIDVNTALVELEEVETTLRTYDREQGAAHRAAEAIDRLHERLTQQVVEMQPLDARCEVVGSLSRLAEGTASDNERRMSLSSYVLAARLEQVAAAATERLLRMSGGRYSLVHTDERDAHNKKSGLGLAVVDGWSGQQRPTSTLSGGESFFASLSLALGLADVVTAEAGGAPLETLFVDEGFGSLDEDTLDEVMSVLDGLRDGGRVVGIVSHVAELRQRIPAQLQIVKDPRGSHLALS